MSAGVELPEPIVQQMKDIWGEDQLPRVVTEAVVVEAYRQGRISRGKVGELLGMGFHERETFLKARNVPYTYCAEDLELDARTMDVLRSEQ